MLWQAAGGYRPNVAHLSLYCLQTTQLLARLVAFPLLSPSMILTIEPVLMSWCDFLYRTEDGATAIKKVATDDEPCRGNSRHSLFVRWKVVVVR